MAAQAHADDDQEIQETQQLPTSTTTIELHSNHQDHEKLLSSYLGLSFAVFLGLIPKPSISLVPTLQSRNRDLFLKLVEAEEELRQLRSRRKEDSKANARVVEIFASHRHAWQQEEKRLLHQIDAGAEEIAHLRARVEELDKSEAEMRRSVEELRREVGERDEMLNFMARRSEFEESSDGGGGGGGCGGECCSNVRVSEGLDPVAEECFMEREGHNGDEMGAMYGQNNGFSSEFLNSTSKFWAERASLWQDVQYESVDSLYHMKHFVARRESPWKVDGETTGVSSKLKLLEQELQNLERIGKGDLSKVPSQMRKQAKRYQALAGKIDDLCRRMHTICLELQNLERIGKGDLLKVPSQMRKQAKRYQALAGKIDDLCRRMASDPCEPNLSSEFRTQRQTEFLIEAFRLQQRAAENWTEADSIAN
ncbi:hypothetical protein TEA_024262 [Camellia sinensis var. sinensis]|uniref:Uncharacterized protein n=1 Tax=Camellia sinensis var. sinensis TaxID=542762 RepID=A0A4S4D9B9_CAMSN|nr:hypothetical protein TEA_024262 [Camellia sinensis var. sinensis]